MSAEQVAKTSYSFVESKKNKIIVYGSKTKELKNFLTFLLNDNNDVAYVSFSDLNQKDLYYFPAGVYIIHGEDSAFIEYLKVSNTFIFYCPTDKENLINTIEDFSKIYSIIENYNKTINFIFVSTTEVYGKKRNEMLFVDSPLMPNTNKGRAYAMLEHYVYNLPSYKIIRIPELYTDDVETKMKNFINYIRNINIVRIPENKEYINFLYPETLYKAIKILMNSQNKAIVHLTDTPNLTFQTFLQSVAIEFNKKIKTSTKVQTVLLSFSKDIPDIFKYDQNLSIIDQEGFGLNTYKPIKSIIKELIEKIKDKPI